jgi:predicted RNA binding protein YcfA (HicA-like mRNA interferase family)
MRLPRDLSGPDLIRLLTKLGYAVTRQAGSHVRLTTLGRGEDHATVSNHSPLRIVTLPSNVDQAHIIVMYEPPTDHTGSRDIVSLARAARASFPKGDPTQVRDEFDATRSEWDEGGHRKRPLVA